MFNLKNEKIIEGLFDDSKKDKKKKKKKQEKKKVAAEIKSATESAANALYDNMYEEGKAYIDAQELNTEQILNGPKYHYANLIKSPGQIGMSGKGDLDTLSKNIDGLFAYVDVLLKGNSKALKGGGEQGSDKLLGTQNFYPTGQSCVIDVGDGNKKEVQRFIYQNFRPTGNIPIDGGDGIVKDMRGLVPGLMENVAKFNPLHTFESMMDVNPTCMLLRMPVTKDVERAGTSTHFETFPVSIVDISQMDPCSFPLYGYRNPATGFSCQSGFRNLNNNLEQTPNDYIDDEFDIGFLYLSTLSLMGLYFVLKVMTPQMKDL